MGGFDRKDITNEEAEREEDFGAVESEKVDGLETERSPEGNRFPNRRRSQRGKAGSFGVTRQGSRGRTREEKGTMINSVTKKKSRKTFSFQRKEIPKIRVKPNVLDKDRERTLSKIATRGVVQLFNAVRGQQKDIQQKLEDAGPLERKKEKVLKSVDKRQFLNVLMGDTKSQMVDNDVKDEERSDAKWNVLREDFMMGAKYKNWDKEDSDSD